MRSVLLHRGSHPQRPVAVIDANQLRNQRVVAERQARYRSHGEQIVIADAVWNELLTNANWLSTLRASFEHLSTEPDALVAS